MASTRNRNEYNNRRAQRRGVYFEDGNAARRLDEVPSQPKKKLATGACVHYIKLTAELTAKRSAVAEKELQLNELKAENDAYYSDVMTNVDLNAIKDRAINELGMEYATEEQIKYYTPGNNNYVRQYQDVPEN